jgi:hypothetical protein
VQNDSLIAVFRALNEASVKYLVVGGIAVISHGHERLTQDLDLVIGFDEGNLLRGLRALVAVGYRPKLPVRVEDFCDEGIRKSWIEEKNMLVFQMWSDVHRRLPVDVFVSEPFDFAHAYKDARKEWLLADLPVTVVDLERLMEMKRSAGRPHDLVDLEALENIGKLRESHE